MRPQGKQTSLPTLPECLLSPHSSKTGVRRAGTWACLYSGFTSSVWGIAIVSHPASNLQWLPTALSLKAPVLDLPYKAWRTLQHSTSRPNNINLLAVPACTTTRFHISVIHSACITLSHCFTGYFLLVPKVLVLGAPPPGSLPPVPQIISAHLSPWLPVCHTFLRCEPPLACRAETWYSGEGSGFEIGILASLKASVPSCCVT